MEGAENIIDEIARSTDEFDPMSQVEMNPFLIPLPYTNEDKPFFGFHGLSGFVYRVCRPGEYIENAICCKLCTNILLKRSIAQHVASGSRYPSRYISTTASLEVASLWAYYKMETDDRQLREIPSQIIQIALEPLKGTRVEDLCANLTNDIVREHFIKGNTHRCFAKSSKEVLFPDYIPQFRNYNCPYPFLVNPMDSGYDSIVYWLITPPVPGQPPPKKKRGILFYGY